MKKQIFLNRKLTGKKSSVKKGKVILMSEIKKSLWVGTIGFLMLLVSCFMTNGVKAQAATKCYTIGTSNVQVYSNTGLTTKYGAIYSTDEITVNAVASNYCKVTYPVSRGTKTGYIRTSNILTKTSGITYSSRAKITTYRRPGGSSYGYISAGDSVKVFGTSGNYTQVKYPVSGGYKYAFITTANYNSYLAPQQNNTVIPSSSGELRKGYTISASNTRVYSNTGLSIGYGWIYGSDEITIQTVTSKYCLVTYPVSRGSKSGYIYTSSILTSTSGNTVTANAKITTYQRPGGSVYGYIALGDKVTVLGTYGGYTQVKYPVSNGYKYAFVTTSNANSYLLNVTNSADNNVTTPSNNENSSSSSVLNNIVSLANASVGQLGTTYQSWANISRSTDWCVAYATYIGNRALIDAGYTSSQASEIVPKQTSTAYMVKWYNSRGLYHSYASWYNPKRSYGVSANTTINDYTPKVGDLVAVDNDYNIAAGPEHTAIVVGVSADTITTAEGNTGSGTASTRRVKIHTYKKGTYYWERTDYLRAKIVGCCSPQY